MARGRHPLVAQVPDPMRKIIRNHLLSFIDSMPKTFDLRGASLGNLILTAGYLNNRRLFDPVIFTFSQLVKDSGTVRPVVNKYRHLVAELVSGERIVAQHRLTGKEAAPIASAVRCLYLAKNKSDPAPEDVAIRPKMRDLIRSSELICYPVGSFYSSLIANLLPRGVGRAVAGVNCPKIYIPNTLRGFMAFFHFFSFMFVMGMCLYVGVIPGIIPATY